MVKYVATYTKGTLKKKDQRKTYLIMFMRFFFLIFFIKAYVVDTHLICVDKSMQFKWVPTTYAFINLYKESDKKYTGCNLKTSELLDCALIGVCAVIRSNTVIVFFIYTNITGSISYCMSFIYWVLTCHLFTGF